MDNLIIVGKGEGGQDTIFNSLVSEGYNSMRVSQSWPRDHYVFFMEKYVSVKALPLNPFGEGGMILNGKDFLLISDMAFFRINHTDNKYYFSKYSIIKDKIISEGGRYYPKARIHVAPSGWFHNGLVSDHIDLFTLLMPQRKILILDTYYGKGASQIMEYDALAEKEGLKLIRYDGSRDNVWFPLNSLILSHKKNDSDVAVIDKNSKSLMRLLKDEGVHTINVEMPQYPVTGKIRCQTNILNPKHKSLLFSLLRKY